MCSEEIQNRQKEEMPLKIQYAAREYYNSAERLNHCAWLFCLVSILPFFLPDNWSSVVSNSISLFSDIVVLYLVLSVKYKVEIAAKLRNYFDAYVLNICPNKFSENGLREIKELAGGASLKNQNKSKTQLANTGKDFPPGVREWYVFPEQLTGIFAKLECQRQNIWWNSKMSRMRFVVTICATILLGIAFILLAVNSNLLTALLCSAAFIIKTIERLIENWKYIRTSEQIDGALRAIDAHPTEEGIEILQKLIEKRRLIPVFELNFFHKKFSRKLSELYEERTR